MEGHFDQPRGPLCLTIETTLEVRFGRSSKSTLRNGEEVRTRESQKTMRILKGSRCSPTFTFILTPYTFMFAHETFDLFDSSHTSMRSTYSTYLIRSTEPQVPA